MSEEKYAKALDHLRLQLNTVHTGRANPSLVENIEVESYGSKMAIKAVASISALDNRTLQIQPWDKGNLAAIEKAIRDSNLGLDPVNDGVVVRVSLPEMTEERRTELAKVVKQLGEEAKVSIRNTRGDEHHLLKEQKEKSEITEDDFYAGEKQLQEKVDKYNEQVDSLIEAKEKEIMTV